MFITKLEHFEVLEKKFGGIFDKISILRVI